jgi:hypothetical protein
MTVFLQTTQSILYRHSVTDILGEVDPPYVLNSVEYPQTVYLLIILILSYFATMLLIPSKDCIPNSERVRIERRPRLRRLEGVYTIALIAYSRH